MDTVPGWRHTVDVSCIIDVVRLRNVAILKAKLICKENWPFLGAFAKLRKATISFFISVLLSVCLSVRPPARSYGTSMFPLDRSSGDLIFQYFLKICRGNSSFNKIWHEYRVLYMKTNIYFLLHLAQFFLEWEIFQTKIVEKIETHILCSVTVPRKSCQLWDNV
jgi:hypothetical protein